MAPLQDPLRPAGEECPLKLTVSSTSCSMSYARLTFFSEETLRIELQSELPNWAISSFGAGKYEPNLFFGYDTSAEELRWKSVVAVKENRAQDYVRLFTYISCAGVVSDD